MNHEDAIRESSVERYMLGELAGEPRNRFEEHLFECRECAADLRLGVTFLEASNEQLAAVPVRRAAEAPRRRFAWLFSPAWMVPALAACLGVIAYDTAVLLPRAPLEVAPANGPAVLNSIGLCAGTPRGSGGGAARQIRAPRAGSFLVSFDIPAQSDFTGYRCSLYSASGALVWQGSISAEQAKDTVQLRIPASEKVAGVDNFLIEGERPTSATGDKFVELSRYQFSVELEN